MKIVLTGSLGNISKPLASQLVKSGHSVTIITSKADRKSEIETLGAMAAIGSMEDADFLLSTFMNADVVYCMITNNSSCFFNKDFDLVQYYSQIGYNYKYAIDKSGVKKVIYLSTNGAHTDKGNGNLRIHYNVEKILEELPDEVSITFIRPGGFYNHLLSFIPTIKTKGMIQSNYGGDNVVLWVSPIDIATAIFEEIEAMKAGRNVRYVVSDELTGNQVAHILGSNIGLPDLKWEVISDEEVLQDMLGHGMNFNIAKGFVEMFSSIQDGTLYLEYFRERPVLGKTKLIDFGPEFAAAFNN